MSAMLELDLDDDKDLHDASERVVGTTKGGKDIVIFWDRTGYCRVKFTTGGLLPARLRGRFTCYQIAEDHVKAYLAAEEQYLRNESLKKAEQEAIEAERASQKRAIEAEQSRLIKEMEDRALANTQLAESIEVTLPKKSTRKVVKKDGEDSSKG